MLDSEKLSASQSKTGKLSGHAVKNIGDFGVQS